MKKQWYLTICGLALSAAPWTLKAQTTTVTFAFTQPAELIASAGGDEAICEGDSVQLNGGEAGGTGPFTYSWTPTSGLSDPSVSDPWAAPADTTDYTIEITDANGCTSMDIMTVNVDSCVGIREIPGLGSVTLFPNPNRGTFKVNASLIRNVNNFSMTITSAEGKVIYTVSRKSLSSAFTEDVSLPSVAKGVYIVRMEFDSKSVERRIVVQ